MMNLHYVGYVKLTTRKKKNNEKFTIKIDRVCCFQ